MNRYEQLLSEYGSEIDIYERHMKNRGLYADRTIWINESLHTVEKTCILAEEVGHYKTSVGDILDPGQTSNIKQEILARAWAYDKLIPVELIRFAIQDGYCETYEIAEYLNVDEGFLQDSLKYYQSKYEGKFLEATAEKKNDKSNIEKYADNAKLRIFLYKVIGDEYRLAK